MRRRSALRLVALAPVVAVFSATVLTACQKVSPTVTASVSPCFRVLPEAHAALGGQGKFVDVARIRGGAVTRFPRLPTTTVKASGSAATPAPTTAAPASTAPAPATGSDTTLAPGRRDVCLVAYSGTFNPALVQHVIRQMGTHYAIVVVGVTSRKVRGVLLTDTLPKPLHAH